MVRFAQQKMGVRDTNLKAKHNQEREALNLQTLFPIVQKIPIREQNKKSKGEAEQNKKQKENKRSGIVEKAVKK